MGRAGGSAVKSAVAAEGLVGSSKVEEVLLKNLGFFSSLKAESKAWLVLLLGLA